MKENRNLSVKLRLILCTFLRIKFTFGLAEFEMMLVMMSKVTQKDEESVRSM
jgi:hypothetical protein